MFLFGGFFLDLILLELLARNIYFTPRDKNEKINLVIRNFGHLILAICGPLGILLDVDFLDENFFSNFGASSICIAPKFVQNHFRPIKILVFYSLDLGFDLTHF